VAPRKVTLKSGGVRWEVRYTMPAASLPTAIGVSRGRRTPRPFSTRCVGVHLRGTARTRFEEPGASGEEAIGSA
jgi:hypothetical protein